MTNTKQTVKSLEIKNVLTEKVVQDYLIENGFKVSQLGFTYITDAIMMYYPNIPLTKGLYPAVAEKRETTMARVERAIRHSIETSKIDTVTNGEFLAVTHLVVTRLAEQLANEETA